MRVSFIGMSNIGKTYWSKRIAAEAGCARVECDALIEQRLGAQLARHGYRGTDGVAQWMGFPSDPHYAENSRLYIAAEQAVMRETLAALQADKNRAAVIDTTGSVIYTGADILQSLRAETCIVYLEASETHIEALYKRYLTSPKPVIWDTHYQPAPGETPPQSLKRCYPDLVRARMQRYRELAHITVPYDDHRLHDAGIGALIREYGNAS